MRFLRTIALFLFVAAACVRCKKDEGIDIAAQRTAFLEFLNEVTTAELTVDRELAREYIYRLIPGPGGMNERVKAGDAVTIEYYGYAFDKGQTLGVGGLFTTNNPLAAIEAGLTEVPELVLPPADLTIRQGAGEILRGIDRGILGAGLNDTILLYLTSDLTYGKEAMGVLRAGTPTVFEVIINGINE